MPKYDSPLGSKQFNSQPMREFNVPDDSGYEQPMPVRNMPEAPHFDEAAFREFQQQQSQMPYPQEMPSMRPMTQVEQDILAAKKAKRQGKERLSEGARRRIEMLIGMTRLTKEVTIGDQLYKIQTLTSQELRDAIVASAEFDGSVQYIFENRKQLLARSITVIAGLDIDQFLNSSELEAKLEFIEMLDHALLLRLFSEYNALALEVQNRYNPKTPEQAKEIVEDLKK